MYRLEVFGTESLDQMGLSTTVRSAKTAHQPPKKGALDVFAVGDLDNGIHMQGMQRKQRRHKGAPPTCSRRPVQYQKLQDGKCKVEKQAG